MSNGGGQFNTAYIAPGGPGYLSYLDPVIPPQTYSSMDPIWSTDQLALVPDVVHYDVSAPLEFEGLNFPSEPAPVPSLSSPPPTYEFPSYPGGMSYPSAPALSAPAWSAPVPFSPVPYMSEFSTEGLVFAPATTAPPIYESPASSSDEPVWYDWKAPLSFEGLNFPAEPEAKSGPLESIGKFLGDVVGGVVDVGKAILDNMDIDISARGDYGGVKTQKAYYSTVGAPAPAILGIPGGATPSATATAVGGAAGGPPMTEDERLYREALGETGIGGSNFILYAVGAYVAYKVLIKK